MKPFFASTDQLWKEQKLAEKHAKFVISTGTQDKKTTCKCKEKRTMDIGGAYAVSRSHSAIWKNDRAWKEGADEEGVEPVKEQEEKSVN
ncbi:hypothetical protein HN873_045656 [Arachis hypogaea]